MFCPRCGQEVPEGSTFCPNCGLKLSSVSAESVDASDPDASPVEIPAPINITPIEVNADGSLAHEESGEPTAEVPAAAPGFVSGVAPTMAAPTSSEAAPRPIDYTQAAPIPGSPVQQPQSAGYTQTVPMPTGYAQQPQGAGYTQAPPAPSAYVQTQPGYASTQTAYTGTPSKSNKGLVIGIIAAAAVVIAAVIFFVLPRFSTSTTTTSKTTPTTTQNTTTNNNGTSTNHPLTTQNNSTSDKGTTTNHPLTNKNDTTTTTTTTPTDASAAGTYYAIWQYDGDTWVYTFILNPDGTGTFKLFWSTSSEVTQEEVDADNYSESIVWTQSGSEVTVNNPDSDTDTLPDAPNTYTLSTSGDKRVLTPEGSEYKYPSETLYEDWNTAYTNMDD